MDFTNFEHAAVQGGTVVASKDHVANDLNGEKIILNLKTGSYYGMNAVGSRIWNLIQEPRTVTELRDVLLKVYDVEPERCECDLLALLQELADEGLIEVDHQDEPNR